MEDKSVRYIVYIIIFTIIFVAALSIFFVIKKVNKNNNKNNSIVEDNHTYTSLKCKKSVEGDITRQEEIELVYQDKDVYQYNITYTYTYKYENNKEKTLSELNTLRNKEIEFDSEHINGKTVNIDRGGVTTLSYDLTDQDVRMYVNSKYFNYNMYETTSGLKTYLANSKNYICE